MSVCERVWSRTRARRLADRANKSLGEVVWALTRQGLARANPAKGSVRHGVPLLPRRPGAAPVTLELVNRLRDEAA